MLCDFVLGLRKRQLRNWFKVMWDDETVRLDVRPPSQDRWQAQFRWDEITLVYIAEDYMTSTDESTESDWIYIHTTSRPEVWVIPWGAKGGKLFLSELIKRGMFR